MHAAFHTRRSLAFETKALFNVRERVRRICLLLRDIRALDPAPLARTLHGLGQHIAAVTHRLRPHESFLFTEAFTVTVTFSLTFTFTATICKENSTQDRRDLRRQILHMTCMCGVCRKRCAAGLKCGRTLDLEDFVPDAQTAGPKYAQVYSLGTAVCNPVNQLPPEVRLCLGVLHGEHLRQSRVVHDFRWYIRAHGSAQVMHLTSSSQAPHKTVS